MSRKHKNKYLNPKKIISNILHFNCFDIDKCDSHCIKQGTYQTLFKAHTTYLGDAIYLTIFNDMVIVNARYHMKSNKTSYTFIQHYDTWEELGQIVKTGIDSVFSLKL